MAELELVAEGLAFPEGPIALADGSVLVVEIQAQTISRVYPNGKIDKLIQTGGGPNGIAVGPDGRIYVCNNGGFKWVELPELLIPHGRSEDYVGGHIQAVDLATGEIEVLYTECNGNALKAPNDLVFDSAGGFYFTDHASSFERYREHGGLYYAKIDGSHIAEIAYPLGHPNGVGLSPGGGRVYIGETLTGIVWGWDIESPGVLAPPKQQGPLSSAAQMIVGLPGHQLFDSLAVDSEGNICAATLITGAITVISPSGEILDVIKMPDPDPLVTNICFGGDDLRTAYITSGGKGKLYKMQWHCPGLKLEFNDVRGI
ncbi:MAG: gluconolactonase precursor [Frankiales bacterium]|nr:gluconolactonase precursor [Frankiales bacterium]